MLYTNKVRNIDSCFSPPPQLEYPILDFESSKLRKVVGVDRPNPNVRTYPAERCDHSPSANYHYLERQGEQKEMPISFKTRYYIACLSTHEAFYYPYSTLVG
jgi:hypothetical protein